MVPIVSKVPKWGPMWQQCGGEYIVGEYVGEYDDDLMYYANHVIRELTSRKDLFFFRGQISLKALDKG